MLDYRKVLISNKGYMKINRIDIAELKNLKIQLIPEIKEISLLDSVSKGKIITNVNGKISFEFNKTYSRFKPSVLKCYKHLQPFVFTLEACVYNNDQSNEESIYIDTCWLEGDVDLFELDSNADFLTEKYEAGFKVESADFTNVISDGENWLI